MDAFLGQIIVTVVLTMCSIFGAGIILHKFGVIKIDDDDGSVNHDEDGDHPEPPEVQ